MRPTPVLLTAALALAGTATAVMLMPGGTERIAMLSRDGRLEQAAEFGNRIQDEARSDPYLLASLFDLNSYAGDSGRAREAIDEYLAIRPDDVEMLRQAVDFFREHQDFDAYLEYLERLVALASRPDDIATLSALYRTHGRYEDEKRVLLAHRAGKLTPDKTERLARLLVRDGEFADAAVLLESVSERGQNQRAVRPLLFEALMRSGEAARAAELATGWAVRGLEPTSQAAMVLHLARAGMPDEARLLASTFPRGARFDPAPLAWALGEERRFDLVKPALNHWMDGADAATLARVATIYVDAAMASGALADMMADIRDGLTDPSGVRTGAAVAVLAEAFNRWGYQGVAPLRHLLTGELLAAHPMFGARLADAESNRIATRYYLFETDLADADEDQADAWYDIAATAFGPGELAAELIARWQARRLAPTLLPHLQRAAAKAGMADPTFDLLRGPPAAGDREAGL